jgi:hypothetical protein
MLIQVKSRLDAAASGGLDMRRHRADAQVG